MTIGRSGCSHLVQQILLGDEVLLEHVLVEVVGRADAPLHAAAGHLYKRNGGAQISKKHKENMVPWQRAFGRRSRAVKPCD